MLEKFGGGSKFTRKVINRDVKKTTNYDPIKLQSNLNQ